MRWFGSAGLLATVFMAVLLLEEVAWRSRKRRRLTPAWNDPIFQNKDTTYFMTTDSIALTGQHVNVVMQQLLLCEAVEAKEFRATLVYTNSRFMITTNMSNLLRLLDLFERDGKEQVGIGWYVWLAAALAVGQLRWHVQLTHTSNFHSNNPLIPPFNDIAGSQLKFKRRSRIKDGAVLFQCSFVLDHDRVPGLRLSISPTQLGVLRMNRGFGWSFRDGITGDAKGLSRLHEFARIDGLLQGFFEIGGIVVI